MSTRVRQALQGAAGAAGGGGLNVEEVFSTYLYEGNQTARTITNGIDLAGEGGLTWITPRTTNAEMQFIDSERGVSASSTPVLISSLTNGEINRSGAVTAYNSDGFDLGTYDATNYSGRDMVSWTFRKAPKFFDVVTYTGNSTAGRTVSHNLGTDVGFMIIKNTTSSGDWICWHRSASTDPGRILKLNATDAVAFNSAMLNNTNPTSTEFTVGTNFDTNGSGQTYVAYLFAHNDGDGDFGPTGDQDIIKCGGYTGNGSDKEIDLGFEPQWLLIKESSGANHWYMFDNMRGFTAPVTTEDPALRANATNAESGYAAVAPMSTGFIAKGGEFAQNNVSYIYIAIRRGPMAVPESATDVFAVDTKTDDPRPAFISDFPVDMALWRRKHTTSDWSNSARLIQGKFLYTNSVAGEGSNTINAFDYQDGWYNDQGADNRILSWMWKRAPNFFDVVCYTGNGTARTIDHNLNVKPDMMWFKKRNTTSNWAVWHKDLTSTTNGYILLDQSLAEGTLSTAWNGTEPTASNFSLGTWSQVNQNNSTFVCYLFASLAGVSKVGSYTGTGASQTIDCGFSSGARFVLIKCTSQNSTPWLVFDSARGITTGVDEHLRLDSTDAEASQDANDIEPHNSGFIVNSANNTNNGNGESYIFYAIA